MLGINRTACYQFKPPGLIDIRQGLLLSNIAEKAYKTVNYFDLIII